MPADAEIWKTIAGYPDYRISSYGRVLSLKGINPRILKPRTGAHGYLHVDLHKDSKGKSTKIARLVAKAFIPNPENKPQINHINGDKTNNHISNLEWSTDSENKQHAISVLGEKKFKAKITSNQAIEIFKKYHSGKYTQAELSREYSISYRAVALITHGRSWSKYTKNLLLQNKAEIQPILA